MPICKSTGHDENRTSRPSDREREQPLHAVRRCDEPFLPARTKRGMYEFTANRACQQESYRKSPQAGDTAGLRDVLEFDHGVGRSAGHVSDVESNGTRLPPTRAMMS